MALQRIQVVPPIAGVQPARQRELIDANACWDALNWLLRRRGWRVRPGLTDYGPSLSERVMGLTVLETATGTRHLVAATLTKLYRYNEGTGAWVDLTQAGNALTGSSASHVIFRVFQASGVNNLLLFNGNDLPKVWDGSAAAYRDILTLTRVPRCAAVIDGRLVVGGFDDGDQEFSHSNVSDFDAGYSTTFRLHETPGALVAIQELGGGSHGLAFKTDALYGIVPYTDQAPLKKEPIALAIVGPVSPAVVVRSGDGRVHYLGEDGGVYVTEGGPPALVSRGIQQWVMERWDFAKRARSWGYYNRRYGEVWFFYPELSTGDVTAAVCIREDGALQPMRWGGKVLSAGYHGLASTGVTWEEVPALWQSTTITWDEMQQQRSASLIADSGGQVREEGGTSDDGAAIAASFETGYQARSSQWFTVVRGRHFFSDTPATQQVDVTLQVSNHGEDAVDKKTASIDLVDGTDRRTGAMVHGRAIGVRYAVDATNEVVFHGAEFEVAPRGRR